jgi:hypothetical protein
VGCEEEEEEAVVVEEGFIVVVNVMSRGLSTTCFVNEHV